MANPQQKIQTNFPSPMEPHFLRTLEQRLAELQRTLSLIFFSKGSPLNVVDAPKGAICLRLDGGTNTTFYVNETGGKTGWVAK